MYQLNKQLICFLLILPFRSMLNDSPIKNKYNYVIEPNESKCGGIQVDKDQYYSIYFFE